MKKEEIENQQRQLNREYEQQTENLRLAKIKSERFSEDLANQAARTLHKINPDGDQTLIFHEVERYQAQANELFHQQRKRLENAYEQQKDEIKEQEDE